MKSSTESFSLGTYRWLALCVFVGVLLAQALSTRLMPVLAWLVGGALIGLAPLGCDQPRSTGRISFTAVSTACVAALAHWLATLTLS